MGVQLVKRIKLLGLAMIELQRDSKFSTSMQPNAPTVNLQPIEQKFWDSIGVVNSGLDWLVNSSEF